ncbi:MAG: biopolymer transporter ExbD [Bacteroidota bacterium]
MARKKRELSGINAGSMADIAFLLLIFFLVTTTIDADKGLPFGLPPKTEDIVDVKIKERNLFNILINSQDMLLIEEQPQRIENIETLVRAHLTNEGRDPELAESSKDAIVSVKTDRGTSYDMYIQVMDRIKAAYHKERANFLGVSVAEYMEIAKKATPEDKDLYTKAREKYPFQVSDAEPTKAGG